MKAIRFLGSSQRDLRDFPDPARRAAGFQLRRLQTGLQPLDFKPMPSIGAGVEELRIWSEGGTFRVIYLARLDDRIFVLHAFEKKIRATAQQDIELATTRYRAAMQEIRSGR